MDQPWPTFVGKPLVPLPESVPVAGFPEGEWGARFLAEYNACVDRHFHGNRSLRVLETDGDAVVGSNYPAAVLANHIVRGLGMHIATPADLERVILLRALPLSGRHVHVALVLRSEQPPNSYLARDLAEQIAARGRSLRVPLMIPLTGLQLLNDDRSGIGVSFRLTEDAEIIEAPQLAHEHHRKRFACADACGLPASLESEGPRTLYTAETGLCGMSVGRTHDLDIYSNEGDLAASDWDGRLVFMRGSTQATDADASMLQAKLASDLNAKYRAYQAVLKKRYERAVRILEGKE